MEKERERGEEERERKREERREREGGREEERERKEKITIIYDVAKMLRLNISQGLGGCPERLFPWGVFVMEGV